MDGWLDIWTRKKRETKADGGKLIWTDRQAERQIKQTHRDIDKKVGTDWWVDTRIGKKS